jgi:two-component system OmpR family response regulator
VILPARYCRLVRAGTFRRFSGFDAEIRSHMRVLIVEGDTKIAEDLKKGLEEEKHRVSLVFDGRTGLELATSLEFDAIVLELMLPVIDGFEVAHRLRECNNQTPILALTEHDAIADITRALDLGADDFLTKPFSFREFLVRLRATARRGSGPRPRSMEVADLVLCPATRRVRRSSHEIHLSPTLYKLLEFLMRRAGRVVSRDAIEDGVWGFEQDIDKNDLNVFVSLLRAKVDRGFSPKLIQTIKGVGYSVREEVEP